MGSHNAHEGTHPPKDRQPPRSAPDEKLRETEGPGGLIGGQADREDARDPRDGMPSVGRGLDEDTYGDSISGIGSDDRDGEDDPLA